MKHTGHLEQFFKASPTEREKLTAQALQAAGLPVPPEYARHLKPTDYTDFNRWEMCASCEEGFRLTKKGRCEENICHCENGFPPHICHKHNTDICGDCDYGYSLDANGQCVANRCVCEHGAGAVGKDCGRSGERMCKKPDYGYHLKSVIVYGTGQGEKELNGTTASKVSWFGHLLSRLKKDGEDVPHIHIPGPDWEKDSYSTKAPEPDTTTPGEDTTTAELSSSFFSLRRASLLTTRRAPPMQLTDEQRAKGARMITQCAPNVCNCTAGYPAMGEDCPRPGAQVCSACSFGWTLINTTCQPAYVVLSAGNCEDTKIEMDLLDVGDVNSLMLSGPKNDTGAPPAEDVGGTAAPTETAAPADAGVPSDHHHRQFHRMRLLHRGYATSALQTETTHSSGGPKRISVYFKFIKDPLECLQAGLRVGYPHLTPQAYDQNFRPDYWNASWEADVSYGTGTGWLIRIGPVSDQCCHHVMSPCHVTVSCRTSDFWTVQMSYVSHVRFAECNVGFAECHSHGSARTHVTGVCLTTTEIHDNRSESGLVQCWYGDHSIDV